MQISVNDIKKRYGRKEVLKNVSFSASGGECIGILGKNGCGKSTLISVLAGILRGDAGQFLIDENVVLKEERIRHEKVAYVPQGTPIIEELSAKDNLSMWYGQDDLKKQLESGFLKVLGIGMVGMGIMGRSGSPAATVLTAFGRDTTWASP